MAYVRIDYHRDPKRIGPHVRYIAQRKGSCGLQGLGPAFRELRGDVSAAVKLLDQHAARARQPTAAGPRDGPFVRMFFTLPTDLAARVENATAVLSDGSRLVLRDAIEATFRSAGRGLQGVYAIHFHAESRAAHGHVHVDLSPLDNQGRPTFLTAEQRARLREAWEREVGKALVRLERRAGVSQASLVDEAARTTAAAPRGAAPRGPRVAGDERPSGGVAVGDERRADAPDDFARRTQRPRRSPRVFVPYVPFVASRLFGWSRTPLTDLFLRALMGRSTRRLHRHQPLLAVRFALGLPVPRVTLRARTPLIPRPLLRVPFTS